MIVKQKLSILFFLKRKKATQDGKIPIYIRITIDGLEDEISLSCKILSEHWNNETKQVLAGDPDAKVINKKITQAKTDIERHFDLMQTKNGLVTPAMVKESYMTPLSGQQLRIEKLENGQLNDQLDELIGKYLTYCERVKKAHSEGHVS